MYDFCYSSASHSFGFLFYTAGMFAAMLLNSSGTEAAEEFRIETEVYVGEEEQPVTKSVTIFEKDAVYDISIKPPELVIYRDATADRPGTFILFDVKKQQRTEVETDKIDQYMKKLKDWAAAQPDPLTRFSAQPEFQEGLAADKTQLSLASPLWTYEVRTIPAVNQASLKRYREFTDWYAMLNALRYSPQPPGPRLALDAALFKHGLVPVEISRRIEEDDAIVRATHVFSWRLSGEDQKRLDEARQQLVSCKKVDAETFLKKE